MAGNEGIVDIFRALKNPDKFGLIIGELKADLPDIKIDIGNGIILDKDDLIFSASILKDYSRTYSIISEDAQLKGNKLNMSGTEFSAVAPAGFVIDSVGVSATPRPVPSVPEGGATTAFTANATDFDLDSQDFKSTGTIILTNQIVTGDKVVLMATETNQLFYVMDKVISF